MQFLVIGRVRADLVANEQPLDFERVVKQEQAYALNCYLAGSIRNLWMLSGADGGVVVFETSTREEVDDLVQNLPLVRAGYLETQILELVPYSGFASSDIDSSCRASLKGEGN